MGRVRGCCLDLYCSHRDVHYHLVECMVARGPPDGAVEAGAILTREEEGERTVGGAEEWKRKGERVESGRALKPRKGAKSGGVYRVCD